MKKLTVTLLSTLSLNCLALEADVGTSFKDGHQGFFVKLFSLKFEHFEKPRVLGKSSSNLIETSKTNESNLLVEPDFKVFEKKDFRIFVSPQLGISVQEKETMGQKIDNGVCSTANGHIPEASCFSYQHKTESKINRGASVKFDYELEKGVNVYLRIGASKSGHDKIENQVSLGFTIDF